MAAHDWTCAVIERPNGVGAFQFVVLSTLRAAQLMRGCSPRIDGGVHKHTTVAQFEVAAGMVQQLPMSQPARGKLL
jgi:DNA-directed RNA polymerase subunit K/omega